MLIQENPTQIIEVPSTSGTPESVVGEVTKKLEEVLVCDALTGKNPRSNLLLGHNHEIILLGEEGDGIWNQKMGIKFPRDVSISGRNLLVTEYWDDSLRVEIINTANGPRDPHISPGSDRLIGSGLVVASEGTEHHNPTVIFDKSGAMTVVRDSKIDHYRPSSSSREG